jgi:hypothetical protein
MVVAGSVGFLMMRKERKKSDEKKTRCFCVVGHVLGGVVPGTRHSVIQAFGH